MEKENMCQQHGNEQASIYKTERQKRQEKLRKHKSGEAVLSLEELQDMAVEAIMARDAGY